MFIKKYLCKLTSHNQDERRNSILNYQAIYYLIFLLSRQNRVRIWDLTTCPTNPSVRTPAPTLRHILANPSGFSGENDPTLTPKIAKSVRILDLGFQSTLQGPVPRSGFPSIWGSGIVSDPRGELDHGIAIFEQRGRGLLCCFCKQVYFV